MLTSFIPLSLQQQDELKDSVDELGKQVDDLDAKVSMEEPCDTTSDNELQRQLDEIEVSDVHFIGGGFLLRHAYYRFYINPFPLTRTTPTDSFSLFPLIAFCYWHVMVRKPKCHHLKSVAVKTKSALVTGLLSLLNFLKLKGLKGSGSS